MSTRFITGAVFAVLGGFLVVGSQSFSPSLLGGVAFGVAIGMVVVSALVQLDRSRGVVQRILDGVTVLLSALLAIFGAVASGAAVTWLTFAFSLGIVGISFSGLSLNEVTEWRAGLHLDNLRWLPNTSMEQRKEQQPRAV